jgi:hypothetical protein
MDWKLAELIGVVMGDGWLSNCQNHYRIGIVGDKKLDWPYFEYLKTLVKDVWNKDPRLFVASGGLRTVINCKTAFLELTREYGIPVGDGKCLAIRIPKEVICDWELARHTIRGLADTDGTIFTADKPGSPNYPSIEITTVSRELAEQLNIMLTGQGFRVGKIWQYTSKLSRVPTYKVALNGYENVMRWMQEIGFSNPRKHKKAEDVLASRALPCPSTSSGASLQVSISA